MEGLEETIYRTMREFRLSNMLYEEGDAYCLVDAMTADGRDISDGEEQMRELAGEIALALRSPPEPVSVVEPVAWHCVGSGDGWAEDKITRDRETAEDYARRPHQWRVTPLYASLPDGEFESIAEKLILMSARGDIAPMSSSDALAIAAALSPPSDGELVRMLTEALEPFAKIGELLSDENGWSDGYEVEVVSEDCLLDRSRAEIYRRARAALSAKEGQKP